MSRLPLLVLLWAAGAARAEAPAPRAAELSAYARVGARAWLSDARTLGGAGGGLGLRGTWRERYLLQADAAYLTQLGNVLEVRVAAGLQRPGFYRPAARVLLSALVGDQLSFLGPENSALVRGPAVGLGVGLAPLRFGVASGTVSALELDVGLGSNWPGSGLVLGVGLLEVSFPL